MLPDFTCIIGSFHTLAEICKGIAVHGVSQLFVVEMGIDLRS